MIQEPNKISENFKRELEKIALIPKIHEVGRVMRVSDGIAFVYGLSKVMSGETVLFENGVSGFAMNLEEHQVGIVILGDDKNINEGDTVRRTESIINVPVGDALLGRVVDTLGVPLDNKGNIETKTFRPVEKVAPGVLARSAINEPLLTGLKAIDSMVPIGKGQRQLILGDRGTGKTAIAIDTIINQKDKNVYCVYVAIGQKTSTITNVVSVLTQHDAMKYTTIVAASAAQKASRQYLAPFSGMAIAEEWLDLGKDVLIIFDDLSKHAVAYRTMSLLLRRPPGREAYPGDVFYLHSRLLERAGKMSKEFGGGSITALPILETLAGNMSSYITTNVISITDGQIYLESESFNLGIRPAINPGLSVSRVGGSAQTKTMRKIASPLRTELAQYREIASFAQFSSDLDEDTRKRLRHGERILETLKQRQFKPIEIEHQIIILFALTKGYVDEINIEDVIDFQEKLISHLESWHPMYISEIKNQDILSKDLEERLASAIEIFKKNYLSSI